MGRKVRRVSNGMKKRLQATVMQGRRATVYKMQAKKNDGVVACFVCGRHVKEKNVSLEHIVPVSHGGNDDMANLAISHTQCNMRRGNNIEFECLGKSFWVDS